MMVCNNSNNQFIIDTNGNTSSLLRATARALEELGGSPIITDSAAVVSAIINNPWKSVSVAFSDSENITKFSDIAVMTASSGDVILWAEHIGTITGQEATKLYRSIYTKPTAQNYDDFKLINNNRSVEKLKKICNVFRLDTNKKIICLVEAIGKNQRG